LSHPSTVDFDSLTSGTFLRSAWGLSEMNVLQISPRTGSHAVREGPSGLPVAGVS